MKHPMEEKKKSKWSFPAEQKRHLVGCQKQRLRLHLSQAHRRYYKPEHQPEMYQGQ
jgi:hypothetical protein